MIQEMFDTIREAVFASKSEEDREGTRLAAQRAIDKAVARKRRYSENLPALRAKRFARYNTHQTAGQENWHRNKHNIIVSTTGRAVTPPRNWRWVSGLSAPERQIVLNGSGTVIVRGTRPVHAYAGTPFENYMMVAAKFKGAYGNEGNCAYDQFGRSTCHGPQLVYVPRNIPEDLYHDVRRALAMHPVDEALAGKSEEDKAETYKERSRQEEEALAQLTSLHRFFGEHNFNKGSSYKGVLQWIFSAFMELSRQQIDFGYVLEKLHKVATYFSRIRDQWASFQEADLDTQRGTDRMFQEAYGLTQTETHIHPEDSFQYAYANNQKVMDKVKDLTWEVPSATDLTSMARGLLIAMVTGKLEDAETIFDHFFTEVGKEELRLRRARRTPQVQEGLRDKVMAAGLAGAMAVSPMAASAKTLIDPGHGGKDPGAVVGQEQEKHIVHTIAQKLHKALPGSWLTRDGDVAIGRTERAQAANKEGGDVFVSLHANSTADAETTASGVEVLYWDGSVEGRDLAEDLVGALDGRKAVPVTVGGRGEAVLKKTTMPAVLIELGFLNNPTDLKNIKDPKWQDDFVAKTAQVLRQHGYEPQQQ